MQGAALRLLLGLVLSLAVAAQALPGEERKVLLIHVKTFDGDNAHRCRSIAVLSLEALSRGRRVVVLFDMQAVKAIKIGSWYGGDTTPLDKIAFHAEEREMFAKELGLSVASAPSNYGELFRLLRGKGVELYAGKRMMKAFGIRRDGYDTVVTPVETKRINDLFEESDVTVSY